MNARRHDSLLGVLLGTAAGDAIGLPREGLSARRAARLFGGPPLRHRLVFGRGMVSDDTEHTCMTAQALLRSGGEPDRFVRSLAWRLRWWILALPAGVGSATARATIKLWLGFPPRRSGVRSEGNGPAMRAAILGAWCADEPVTRLIDLVTASTRLTHTTPAAEQGALAVALAARHGALHGSKGVDAAAVAAELLPHLTHEGLRLAVEAALRIASAGGDARALGDALNINGAVSGWMLHTVPVALFCWLRHPRDYRAAVETAVMLGGDTDTVAAIVGGLVGATSGAGAVPAEWLAGICEWPRSIAWMREVAIRLAELNAGPVDGQRVHPVPLFWPGVLVRNVLFLGVVLLHGFRRLLPPY